MAIIALIVTLGGAAIAAAGALWLFFGFRPNNPRYVDDGPLHPGQQRSLVVPNLLHDQRRAVALVAAGTAVQVVGGVLAVLSTV